MNASLPLFRPELEGKSVDTHGVVVLRPRWAGTVAFAAVCIVAGVVFLLAFGSYRARVTAHGMVAASRGLAPLLSEVGGVVRSVDAVESDEVRVGQVVATVVSDSPDIDGESRSDQITAQLSMQRSAVEDEYKAQIDGLSLEEETVTGDLRIFEGERSKLAEEIPEKERLVELATEALTRARNLNQKGFVSEAFKAEAESELLQFRGQLRALQHQAQVLDVKIGSTRSRIESMPARRLAISASYSKERALLERAALESERLRKVAVTASVSGRIGSLALQPGQAIAAGEYIGTIIPSDSYAKIDLFVPGRAVGVLPHGAHARVRFEAFPYQKYGQFDAKLSRISRVPLSASELTALGYSGVSDMPLYHAILDLESQSIKTADGEYAFVPGMQVEVELLLEQRKLWEWLISPVKGMQSHVSE